MTSPRARAAFTGFAALGLLALAGCAVDTASADPTSGSGTSSGASSGATSGGSSSAFTDGTYTVDAGYQAPSGTESITVELTIADDTVAAVTVTGHATDREAREFQERFTTAIADEIVGQDISSLSVTRVAGASLTSTGFNTALDEIRSQAA